MTIAEVYKIYLQYPVICTDTRRIVAGSIFFALKGANFDGNKFAAKAIEKGCAYAIADDPAVANHERIVLVSDVLRTLQELAAHHRSKLKIPVLGLTGSNGKTTTKELIAAALQSKYKVLATSGNLNNHIGVPLTLLRINDEHEIAIVEMGTNSPGEIEMLTNICQPSHGLITNIGKAHLEKLIDLDGVEQEKTALYRYLQKNDGHIFYNADDGRLANRIGTFEPITEYSISRVSEYDIIIRSTFPKIQLSITKENQHHEIRSKMYGAHNVINFSAALAIGTYFGVDLEDIAECLSSYQANNNRTAQIAFGSSQIYLDAYNANPSSMKAALQAFLSSNLQNKVVVIGDMMELGDVAHMEHIDVLSFIQSYGLTEVWLYGDQFAKANLHFDYQHFADIRTLRIALNNKFDSSAHIFIKGSRSMALERLLAIGD